MSLFPSGYPPTDVLSMRNRFKVVRIYACPVSTEVVNLQAVRYFALVNLIIVTMRALLLAAPAYLTVALVVLKSLPFPAPRFIVNNIVDRGLSVHMSRKKPNRLTPYVAKTTVGLSSNRGLSATSALAESRWIRPFSFMRYQFAVTRLTANSIGVNRVATIYAFILDSIRSAGCFLLPVGPTHPTHVLRIVSHRPSASGARLCEWIYSRHIASFTDDYSIGGVILAEP